MIDELDPNEPESVLAWTTARAREAFGDRLVASFAIGSLAHGGFCPNVSDVDLAVILAQPVSSADRDSLDEITRSVRTEGGLAGRLSLFWATAQCAVTGFGEGRLPAVDRLDLALHGRCLWGTFDLDTMALPSREQLIVEAVEFALAKFANNAANAELRDPFALARSGERAVTKRVLFPVRFLFTASTGQVGENNVAVEWYLNEKRPAADLVDAAHSWRCSPLDPAAGEELLRTHVVALYDEFITEHIGLMTELEEPELARRLEQWRFELQAG